MNPLHRSRLKWLGLLAVLTVLAVSFFRSQGKSVGVVHVERGNLTQTIAATGRINAPVRTDVAADITAKVVRVLVREGERVKAGNLLIELDAAQARATLAQANAAQAEAQVKLSQQSQINEPQSRQNLTQAETAYQVASRDHERARDLVQKGFYSQQKLDETRKLLDAAQSAFENAKLQANANASKGIEAQLVRSRLDQAQAGLEQSRALLDKYRILAPYDAIILTRNTEPGNLAQPGKLLLSLAATGGTRIDTTIDEKNLAILQMGMPAKAATDAFPSKPFDAKLAYVAPAVDAQKGTVDVRLDIANPPDFLRTDMTVSVELKGSSRANVLLLPLDAIREPDGSAPWVLAVRDGVATRQNVQLGIRGVGLAEILKGVGENDEIISVSEAASEGDRVRPRQVKARAKGIEAPQGMFR